MQFKEVLFMIIQSKKVWIADQFMPAQIEMDGGKIVGIHTFLLWIIMKRTSLNCIILLPTLYSEIIKIDLHFSIQFL